MGRKFGRNMWCEVLPQRDPVRPAGRSWPGWVAFSSGQAIGEHGGHLESSYAPTYVEVGTKMEAPLQVCVCPKFQHYQNICPMTLEWRYISRECKHTKTFRLLLAEDVCVGGGRAVSSVVPVAS